MTARDSRDSADGMPFRTFVGFVAALMALNALALDVMLPALPQMGEALQIGTANEAQWVITAYLLGFGGAQIVYGPLADHFGRRPVLLAGLAIYTGFSLLAAIAQSLELMILARVIQGVGAGACRVLSVSLVRDRFEGREMAKVMSLTFIVLLAVPILAPSLGQLALQFLTWPWLFVALGVSGAAMMAWTIAALPETLRSEDRRPLGLSAINEALRLVMTNRRTMAYVLGSTLISGALFGYLACAPQIFSDALHAPGAFTGTFAAIALCMACAAFLNARLVVRRGMRRISVVALGGYIAISALHVALASFGALNVWTFGILQSAIMFCFGLIGSNFGALAMQPMGHIAGTASSLQGFVTTVGGALIGYLIGQLFDGTTLPLAIGFLVSGCLALALVWWAEWSRPALNAPPKPSRAEG